MSGNLKQKYKHTYRLWRVNVDGTTIEGRWKNALGAINGACDRLFGNANLERHGIGGQRERPDFTDMVIHVECIGGPEKLPERCPETDEQIPDEQIPG